MSNNNNQNIGALTLENPGICENGQPEYSTEVQTEIPTDEEQLSPDLAFTCDIDPQEQEAQDTEDLPAVDLQYLGTLPDNPMEGLEGAEYPSESGEVTAERALAEQLSQIEGPAVVLTVGLPGGGKTTLLKGVIAQFGQCTLERSAVVVSPDKIRDEMAGVGDRQAAYDPGLNGRVFGRVDEEVRRVLDAGDIAIVDGTHMSTRAESNFRVGAVEGYRSMGATVVALVLDVPLDVALDRNTRRAAENDGFGYVQPADIKAMHAYSLAHPISADNPAEFDLAIVHPDRARDPASQVLDKDA